MTGPVSRFLRFIAIANGRTRTQIAVALDCSLATVKRLAEEARELGVSIEVAHEQHEASRYVMRDSGPFDVAKLQMLPWRSMGRKG